MKVTIASLACALIAPIAFAQTSTTTTETTTNPTTGTTTTVNPATSTTTTDATTGTSSSTTTSTTYTAGTVTTYSPGKTVVVRGPEGPVSFALGTAANIVDAAGKVVTAPLRAGQKVKVYYTGPTEKRTVERVVVED